MIGLRSRRVAAPGLPVADWVPVQSSTDDDATARRSDHVVPEAEHVLRSALVRFVVSSVLALVVVAGGTVFWSLHIAENEALQRAQATGIGVANGVIKPFITPALRRGDPTAKRALDNAVRNRMADGSIYRVKIWTADQRILYSDETPLIGKQFDLDEEDQELFGTSHSSAEMSDLTRQENVYEADQNKLVEVYSGFTGVDGTPLVFEAYLPYEQVKSAADVLLKQLLPLSIGSLGLLLLLLLPLAISLARRTERAQRERNRMLSTSIAASDVERRRIARDLHDGVVQDLAGLGYALTAIADGLPAMPESEAARQGTRKATTILRRDVDALRTLVTDIYPPELEEGQLVPAISAMLRTVGTEGPRMSLHAPDHLDVSLGRDASVLLYRVVREAVRNAVKHARASAVQVRLRTEPSRVMVEVVDDGVGMLGDAAPGHFGLRLLADTVHDAGGEFSIDSRPGAGVRVCASLPVN
jgi:signal transduction histidine kinase